MAHTSEILDYGIGAFIVFNKKVLFKSDSAKALPWEAYNMDFVLKKGWGDSLNFTTAQGIDQADFISKVKA